ncbi:MAG: hypothetical protein R3B84_02135 [Zavarzinella sp.]
MKLSLSIACSLVLGCTTMFAQEPEEKKFSGPQVGEKLPAFKVRGVYGEQAGKELDFVTAAGKKPIVLVFVHDFNRLSASMTRTLTEYTASRAKDGLHTGIVWLTADATEAEATLKRVQHAMAKEAPIGIYTEGIEGPGNYGLNRNVMLTILVGNEGKVTANFALVQPSIQADLPKILEAVVKQAGGKVPDLKTLTAMPKKDPARPMQDPNLRGLLVPVISKTATPEDVAKAAKKVEEYAEKNPATRAEIGRIANTIIDAGKLENYGTPAAQEVLKKWAKEFVKPSPKSPR